MAQRLFAPILNLASLALPPRCAGCGAVTGEDHRFCASCWQDLRFLGQPWCAACARPFAHDLGDAHCATCIADPPPHDGVRAAVAYGDVARTVVLKLKYGRRLAHAATVARQMARLMPDDADMILPVPLHRWRLWSRGFNQAQLIGGELARLSGVALARDVLVRAGHGGSLRGRGRKARRERVRNAFLLAENARERVGGRHVVLVDDVYASGATGSACARVLKAGGAAKVTILCWARVLDDEAGD